MIIKCTEKVYYGSYKINPLGTVYLASTSHGLCALFFEQDSEEEIISWLTKHFSKKNIVNNQDFNHPIAIQVQEYCKGQRSTFDINLDLRGTDFQIRVWQQLLKIPYGQTITYKELAFRVGGANYCRAVGGANNKNPIPIIVPCHRVIGSNGKLVGYALGLDIKEKLLHLEKA